MGHNTDFLTKAAFNMLYVLTPEQKAQLVTLAQSQVQAINQYAYNRFPLMQAFRRLLEGQVPDGAPGLSKSAVEEYSAGLYRLDGQISLQRAQVMGGILHDLNAQQRAYLDKLKGIGMVNWPNLPEQIDKRSMTHDVHVAVMTYAGDLFAWYMGDVEADVYFCPERQGTYFGGFYMKDAPAMGNPNYTISNRLTGDMGEAFVALLSQTQAQPLYDLVNANAPLLNQIVEVRQACATELRKSIAGQPIDQAAVLKLCEQYGRLDGDIVWGCATAFARTAHSLTAQQKAQVAALRQQAGNAMPQGAYLYSTPIPMPSIPNTDTLFGAN
jgi:Spy/CpxP family protein refolding chaperone